ncbi:hypothetical protein DDM60_002659 [Vibrio cholerae]|uniref:Uncharacterized protein n=1 Tax=Vibrio cholerae TaxID=666 RepID=A0A7Z7VKC1_VIBCL|nr:MULTISPECIES: hypothetical protein [Vibrio]EGQ9107544.1 hypothetical protein [Vibrio cholerae]EGR3853013.1 hypothetical protein [Vibrio cholerae]ELJ8564044.1 hypothetical protein [Vibrio cholerae]QIL87142.1 hypothetical protein G7083_14700 [Vibrio sp. HDW18]TBM39768.1 hypothetical protein EYB64_16140 [Vibrio cholerae]
MTLTRGSVLLCQKANFRAFLSQLTQQEVNDADTAAKVVRELCQVQSRRELDTLSAAAERYRVLIRQFNDWLNNKREMYGS